MIRGLFAASIVLLLFSSCIVRHLVGGPKLTGTCRGACSHYVDCKPGVTSGDRQRCEAECPSVFSDRTSLMAFESLSCKNTVEYVDGSQPRSATKR